MKLLAFGASNSGKSINKMLAIYAASLLESKATDGLATEILDMKDYEMPLYGIDREEENGIPEQAQRFYNKIGEADALVISLAEHNGYYTAVYKNLFDWASRIDRNVYQGKPAVLLSTSPGPRGADNILQTAQESAQFFGMSVKATLSIPSFFENFDVEQGRIIDDEIQGQLQEAVATLIS